MKTIFLDFESYYDKEYSLKKMTPVEYILDPRFEAIGCAVKESLEGAAYWVEGPELPKLFASFDPGATLTVTHNALFDNCIMAWKYDFVPKLMACTLGMSRACLGHELRYHSLAKVGEHLGIGHKGDAVLKAIGMNLASLKAVPSFYDEYIRYALNDVNICAGIYDRLFVSRRFPMSELVVMDTVLRCAISPKFKIDPGELDAHYHTVVQRKNQLLATAMLCGADGRSDLMSNNKFAELLVTHGVIPPRKISKLTGQLQYAFAKTDPEMVELEEHENPAVQALVAARLGHKSTLEETRTLRLKNIAGLTWPSSEPNILPIPLRYAAAHTHRLGGDWKLNFQNVPHKSRIRRALKPRWPDHSIVMSDASQIEARGVAWISGQDDLVARFASGEDVYASFASDVSGHSVTKKTHPGERFMGKTCILGLGYQSGAATLKNTIRVQSKKELGKEMIVSDEEAQRYVSVYRNRYSHIRAMWHLLNTTGINVLAFGGATFKVGPCEFGKGVVHLPNGLGLHYDGLRRDDNEWWFDYAGAPSKLYGGKLLENIIQALSRIVVMDAAVRLRKRGFELAIQVHDALGYVVPDKDVATSKVILLEEMARRPSWAPGWPLASEVYVGKTYGDE